MSEKSSNKSSSGGGVGGTTANTTTTTATASRNYYPLKDSNFTATTTNSSSSSSNAVHFLPSSKLKLLHQRSSLSLAYDREKGWGYQGETALYVIAATSSNSNSDGKGGNNNGNNNATTTTTSAGGTPGDEAGGNSNNNSNNNNNAILLGGDGKPIEMALHLRDGCLVESVQVYVPATTVKTTIMGVSSSSKDDNGDGIIGDIGVKSGSDGDVDMEELNSKPNRRRSKLNEEEAATTIVVFPA